MQRSTIEVTAKCLRRRHTDRRLTVEDYLVKSSHARTHDMKFRKQSQDQRLRGTSIKTVYMRTRYTKWYNTIQYYFIKKAVRTQLEQRG